MGITSDFSTGSIPANIYLFKANNGNTGTMFEICSKLTIKTPVSVYVEQILHIVLEFT